MMDFLSMDWGYGKFMIYFYIVLTYFVANPLRASQTTPLRASPTPVFHT
jgi:hypothetical protein